MSASSGLQVGADGVEQGGLFGGSFRLDGAVGARGEGGPGRGRGESTLRALSPQTSAGAPLAGPLVPRSREQWVRNLASHPPPCPGDRNTP